MEPSRSPLDRYHIDVLSTVYIVLLTPSVIGSFSVLVVSIVKWRHLQQQVFLLVQLALADLLAALVLMSTSVLNKIEHTNSVMICLHSLSLSVTFYVISVLLVAVYAWESKKAIQGWRARPFEDECGQSWRRRQIVAILVYGLVWLIPIAIYLAYVYTGLVIPATEWQIVSNSSTYCNSCILFLHVWDDSCPWHGNTFIWIFFLLVVITVMFCSIIYYNISKWYERHQHQGLFPVEGDGRSRRTFKRMISAARNRVIAIIFCWTPALVLVLISPPMMWPNVKQNTLFGFYVIQAVSVSLQGFLNSMIYAWTRPNFREAVLGESTPLVAQSLAFFDESLRN